MTSDAIVEIWSEKQAFQIQKLGKDAQVILHNTLQLYASHIAIVCSGTSHTNMALVSAELYRCFFKRFYYSYLLL